MNATQSMDTARMTRIKKVSKILRAVMLALLIVYGAGVFAEVFAIPITIIHHLDSKITIPNCEAFITLLFTFMVTLNFFRVFTRLKDGHLFEGQTIEYLERAGKWWIALGISRVICQAVRAYIFPADKINIAADGIFCGLIVFFIAWVLREGQKLKEEQELTV